MALKIRLRQQGRTNRQTYRVVLADVRSPRDGKYQEMLGWYYPFQEEGSLSMNAERISYWLNLGAEPSEQVQSLMEKAAPEVLKEYRARLHERRIKAAAKRRALRKASKA
jgi:small subunit ribosomal protein S16